MGIVHSMTTVLLIVMLATLAVLIAGIAIMGFSPRLAEKYGNQLMFARVALQAVAIFIIIFNLRFYFSKFLPKIFPAIFNLCFCFGKLLAQNIFSNF